MRDKLLIFGVLGIFVIIVSVIWMFYEAFSQLIFDVEINYNCLVLLGFGFFICAFSSISVGIIDNNNSKKSLK